VAQSGRPEVTVSAPAAAVKSQLINEMLNHGFSIVSDSPYLVVFEKVSDNIAAMFLFGTRYGGAPHVRASFSIADMNGSTRVVSDLALIGNAGTAFRKAHRPEHGTDAAEAQQMLNLVASSSARRRRLPAPSRAPVSSSCAPECGRPLSDVPRVPTARPSLMTR
jgi:hypothetical protein